MIKVTDIERFPKEGDDFISRKSSETNHIIKGIVINKRTSKAYNVIIELDTPRLEKDSKAAVYCTCEDFRFRWAAILYTKQALLYPNRFRLDPPKITNPDGISNACKHIHHFVNQEYKMMLHRFSTKKGEL